MASAELLHTQNMSGSLAGKRGRQRWRALMAVWAVFLATAVVIPTAVVAADGVAADGVAADSAGITTVGSGSYTTDEVGPLPSGCGDLSTNPRQFLTDDAPAGAIPTNDWWSSLVFKRLNCRFSENLEAHPAVFLPRANGLGISYPTTPQIVEPGQGLQEYHYTYSQDFTAGMPGLNTSSVKVANWSDWTVTPSWSDGTRTMTATIGHGLPMTYFKVAGGGAQLTTAAAPRVWQTDGAAVGFTVNGHDYVAFAPTGAGWQQSGNTLTSDLAGKDYYTVAVLPTSSTDAERTSLLRQFGRYAYATVTGTTLSYQYDQRSSAVQATYSFSTTPSEGSETGTVTALYQHQWKSLVGATPIAQQYVSPRGPMKILMGVRKFSTSMVFHGVLPEVPAVADSSGADAATLDSLLQQAGTDPMAIQKADTYWTGKGLGRAARIAEIADQVGNTSVRDTALGDIKQTLTDWFTASPGKSEQVFYYDQKWGTLIGYPASYGSDSELNDHHFHYGYFIAAAATVARFDPTWASNSRYGGMVDLLIRDANNYSRTDTRFPYLRDFDIYAGHDWASGHGAFAAGNNQESSSEGMNFANALIQWGQATGNTEVRDAGIFIYTTQSEAIAQYWFDVDGTTFPDGWQHSAVGMVWGDGGSYATWFSPEPEKIQGINMLPITGGHLYLGYDPDYVKRNYQEIVSRSGGAPRVWQDIIWEFLATGDPDKALSLYRANNSFTPEEGESAAHTFHWIRNLAALGVVDTTVSADSPLAMTFVKNGLRTYVASNLGRSSITVTYSDGTTMAVPAGRTVTTGALGWAGGSSLSGGGTSSTAPSPTGSSATSSPVTPSASSSGSSTPTVGPSVSSSSVSSSPTASPSVSGSPTSVSPSPSAPTSGPSSIGTKLYLSSSGALGAAIDQATSISLRSADGANRDGTPYQPSVFIADHLTMPYRGGATAFTIAVDSGNAIANAVQLRVCYDLTGNGTWDRVETYRYFATDPVPGSENYTQTAGLSSSAGDYGNLAGGKVRVEIWSALTGGTGGAAVNAPSWVTLPFS